MMSTRMMNMPLSYACKLTHINACEVWNFGDRNVLYGGVNLDLSHMCVAPILMVG